MIEYENLHELNRLFAKDFRIVMDEVLTNGQFILGTKVTEFENQFADYCGSKFCVGVANGTDAITLALKSFSLEAGAEVLVPANTYMATIVAILNAGLKPVLVEPDMATCNMDPQRLEGAITKRTAAIMAVHLYGKCCDMDAISLIARKHDLELLEDCAQAHGAKFKGRSAGTFGSFGAFSFYPTKNLGALGDAGCVTTDSQDKMELIRMLRNYGTHKKNEFSLVGTNSRLDELQAAFLTVKLRSLNAINNHKRTLADIYHEVLKEDFMKPVVSPDYYDVYHIFHVRHPRRDKLRDYLLKNGIKTEIHYPIPPHRQAALQNMFRDESFPISEEIHATTLSLPISYIHTEDDISAVAEIMNKF